MSSFNNQVQLLGRLGDRPCLTSLTDGAVVARCRLYVAEFGPPTEGEVNTTATFRLVGWGPLAEAIHRDLRRGDRVIVRGRLRNRSFRHDGQVHVRTEIHLDNFSRVARSRGDTDSDITCTELMHSSTQNPLT